MLFALAAGAVLLGAGMVAGIFSTIFLLLHWLPASAIVDTLFRAAITPFSIVLLAIYYFDVEFAREGFDLEAGLERLVESAPAT